MKSILYLGCPDSERPHAEKVLTDAEISVAWADSLGFAIDVLQRREMPVLVDLSSGAVAIQVARYLRTHNPDVPLFAVGDDRRPSLTTEAVLTGVVDVFPRPLGGRSVAAVLDRERRIEPQRSNRAADGVDDVLYAQSSPMREVVELITRAATDGRGVMIRGEDGTGRRPVARAIHSVLNADEAFVHIDCAAYDDEQLEAELFGERPVASLLESGHRLEHIGRGCRLEQARGGTLYLSHIADAPACLQARLARLLRDREAVLGEEGSAKAFEVQAIASVDPGIEVDVDERRMNENLFEQLSAVRIDMPPLCRRREDIPALANSFLRQICAAKDLPPSSLSRSALALIVALPWHGNGIELRAVLENALRTSDGRSIGVEHLLAHVRLDGGAVMSSHDGTLRQARARFEHEYIAHVLRQYHGRISQAAKALGIQRPNLYRKMRALRVVREKRHS